MSASLPQAYREEYGGTLRDLRAHLGEEKFAIAWAEGQAMTLEEAVEHALRANGG
jgi:hypothetical protein